MARIKFSHLYQKLLDSHNDAIETATLLGVFVVRLEDLHQSLIDYDTDNGTYKLPKKGKYLTLLFLKPHADFVTDKNLFTTIRRCTPQKYKFYRGLIGKKFDVVVSV